MLGAAGTHHPKVRGVIKSADAALALMHIGGLLGRPKRTSPKRALS